MRGLLLGLTVAETYVSRVAPNTAALAPRGQGVEFHALAHPNDILAGDEARFQMLLDGKPTMSSPTPTASSLSRSTSRAHTWR